MKKIINIVWALSITAFVMFSLTGCNNSSVAEDTTAENTQTADTTVIDDTREEEPEVVYDFPALPSEEEILLGYRNQVLARLEQEEFLSEEEKSFLTEVGYEVGDYAYPILYKDGNLNIWMVHTLQSGYVERMLVYRNSSVRWSLDYPGNAHTSEKNIIKTSESFAIAYDSDTGKISLWRFGQKQEEHTVPVGAVYTGVSEWEGYIFRAGTDVYALQKTGVASQKPITGEGYVQIIAHNVQQVILANYMAGSDDWSQPLFLMEDGSLKVYSSWYGDPEAPADDISHLKNVEYEGGYLQPNM